MRFVRFLVLILLAVPRIAVAQSEVAAEPTVGLRDHRPQSYALTGAEVVVEAGTTLSGATILVEGTAITAVGPNISIPAGFQVIDCQGKRIYPGLIDAWSEQDVPLPDGKSGYWNQHVTPQRNAAESAVNAADVGKLRSQGITTRLVAPRGGIVKGSSSVVLLDGTASGRTLLRERAWQHAQLTVPRSGPREQYPNSPMGATALLRQAMLDAQWYRQAWEAYRANPELSRPETNVALDVLSQALTDDTFVFDAQNERMAIRADQIAREFACKMILRGSGREYRELASIVAANRPILVPVGFPEAPNVKSAQALEDVSLQELMHWDLAPENPCRLAEAGATFCLTTDGLDDVGQFLKQVRIAIERGLDPNTALQAMTTVPAQLLGIDQHVGRIQVGMLANLAITDGDLFSEQTKVLECWVAGTRFELSKPPNDALAKRMVGDWQLQFRDGATNVSLLLAIAEKNGKFEGVLRNESQGEPSSSADNQQPSSAETEPDSDEAAAEGDKENEVPTTPLQDLAQERDRITATVRLHDLNEALDEGVSLLTIVTVSPERSGTPPKPGQPEQRPATFASLQLPSGETVPVTLRYLESAEPAEPAEEEKAESESESSQTDNAEIPADDDDSDDDEPGGDDPEDDDDDDNGEEADKEASEEPSAIASVQTPLTSPLGAYGLESPIRDQPCVLFRGATLWTCDQDGVLESGDLLIRDGKILAVGKQLDVPQGCQVIDVRGKHITPGLIDCHSHMGTDGGINESGQEVTAEVRIGDFLDNSDINIYRQLAGGLTSANILHGSANPIGGQNQVIKLRWGETMDGLRMKEAPAGIKFALGENVKRNQGRYPNTRMGVEQIIRDQLLAAREYQATWRRWREGQRGMLPPRVDLQLEALSEVQQGTRWIHCHSYRQDEIVATLDVLEEFGIRIGTLQHILEGYKVADRMAQHGAMGSSFSDWWAYKFEVFDAIPYNGALMHDRGVVVSFNSDDRELARHMNTEAAKATRYGGVPEEEALKFVTTNPARQLRIDQYVGSLTAGKHADLVIWSGRPLSTLSRCEQTWIDGKCYFDLQTDQKLRTRDHQLRARLIQKVLGGGASPKSKRATDQAEVAEEDRWVRTDVYCTTHGGLRHETINQGEQR